MMSWSLVLKEVWLKVYTKCTVVWLEEGILIQTHPHNMFISRFNQNYGVLGLLDWLHGTDTQFRNHKAFQRDRVLLRLVPASTLFPD